MFYLVATFNNRRRKKAFSVLNAFLLPIPYLKFKKILNVQLATYLVQKSNRGCKTNLIP